MGYESKLKYTNPAKALFTSASKSSVGHYYAPYYEGTFYDFARYVHFKEGADFFRSDFSGADWEREREQETL